jgi:hypothetical protein
MASKTEKMRDKLATIQKDRAEFEKKKKELAAQMSAMSNIAKQRAGGKGSHSNLLSPSGSSASLNSLFTDSGGSAKVMMWAVCLFGSDCSGFYVWHDLALRLVLPLRCSGKCCLGCCHGIALAL